jgi:HK97 family phage portal protein
MAESIFASIGRALAPASRKALSPVSPTAGGSGWVRIFESFAGAWQHNVVKDYSTILSNPTLFACQTLIAGDIAKLRIKLVQRQDGIWTEVDNFAYPVLTKPNHFQTRIQFMESWVSSKLSRGNTIVLKQRNRQGDPVALYVLDWQYVTPLIAENGDVFYELNTDSVSSLAALGTRVVVPAREIMHDRFNCLFHPLIGLSPIFANGLPSTHGLAIMQQASKFFENGARPGGILTAPGAISDETATRLKESWDSKFGGENAGKIAVLGDGLKYEAMTAKAVDSQLIEQLKWTSEAICSTYHVPPYKVGVGPMPSVSNVQALNVEYYAQCLQVLLESIEILFDEGLGLRGELGSGRNLGVEFDLDGLLRMDTSAQMEALEKGRNYLTPNDGRRRLNLPAVPGGDVVLRQQQDFSLEALAKRDAQADPFTTGPKTQDNSEEARSLRRTRRKRALVSALVIDGSFTEADAGSAVPRISRFEKDHAGA